MRRSQLLPSSLVVGFAALEVICLLTTGEITTAAVDAVATAVPSRCRDLHAATWNVAAVNNNPFEYHITTTDAAFNQLVADFSDLVTRAPPEADVPTHDVFTDEMFAELVADMRSSGSYDEQNIAIVIEQWRGYRSRRVISEFVRDHELGKKRLISMPDRMTNTVKSVGSRRRSYRPTTINCYGVGDLGTMSSFWAAWRRYMFQDPIGPAGKTGHELLRRISRKKYPHLSELEERASLPLQTLVLAVYDAVTVHLLNRISSTWQELRLRTCEMLCWNKVGRTLEILQSPHLYGHHDVLFLQETNDEIIDAIKQTGQFHVSEPATTGPKRQASLVLLRSGGRLSMVRDVSEEVRVDGLSDEDLLAVVARGKMCPEYERDHFYLLASFHGDTNGLMSIPTIKALHSWLESHPYIDRVLIGMDANTYSGPPSKGKQSVPGFAATLRELGMTTHLGTSPNASWYTTFHARTMLQPQLNKGMTIPQAQVHGDRNLKDFLIWRGDERQCSAPARDNTGRVEYVENMIFPTRDWPSDHGAVSCVLQEGGGEEGPPASEPAQGLPREDL